MTRAIHSTIWWLFALLASGMCMACSSTDTPPTLADDAVKVPSSEADDPAGDPEVDWLDQVPEGFEGLWVVRLSPGERPPARTPQAWNPISEKGYEELEGEVGFPYESISLLAEIDGKGSSVTLVATSADLTEAADRVMAHPYWGSQAVSAVVDGWTVLEFSGEELDLAHRSNLRLDGRGGSLGYGPDGFVLWSHDRSGVRAAIEAGPAAMSASFKREVRENTWTFLRRSPPHDPFDSPLPTEELAEIYRDLYAPENTLDIHHGVTFAQATDSDQVVVLIEHQTSGQAAENASRFPDLLSRSAAVDIDGSVLAEHVTIEDIETLETVVSITLGESRPGVVIDHRTLDPPFAMTLGPAT